MMAIASDNPSVLNASEYIASNQELVASALLLADAIVSTLQNSVRVVVELKNLRSVSSSYFNVLLTSVAEQCGVASLRSRLLFKFSSTAQQEIFQRSFDAVLRSL